MGELQTRSRGGTPCFLTFPALVFRGFSPTGPLMTLVSIPANPVPEDSSPARSRPLTAWDCALRAGRRRRAARARSACSPGAASRSKNISRRCAICATRGFAVAMHRLARAGPFAARSCAIRARVTCAISPTTKSTSDLHGAGGAAGLPAAVFRAGAFDGRRGAAAGGARRQALVRPHRAVGADDRSAGTSHVVCRRAHCCAPCGCSGRAAITFRAATTCSPASPNFIGNPLTSDPVRFARNAAILEEDPTLGLASPTVAWADTALRAMHDFRAVNYPVANSPAAADDRGEPRHHRLHRRDRGVRLSPAWRLASGHRRSKHEILQEQDRYRAQFWAAFDAFVPGTPLF